MKITMCAILLLSVATMVHGSDDSDAEAVVVSYFQALNERGFAAGTSFMHPEALSDFKEMIMPAIEVDIADRNRELTNALFGTQSTAADLREMPAEEFMNAFMHVVSAQMDDITSLIMDIETLGTVRENDVTHVVVRLSVGSGDIQIRQMEVVSVKPTSDGWGLMLTGEMEGMAQALRAR